MALDDLGPEIALEFDTPRRKLKVFYDNNLETIQSRIESLGLGATLDSTQNIGRSEFSQAVASADAVNQKEAGILKWLLAINGIMFGIEMVVGWYAQSTGLIADSLDMSASAVNSTPGRDRCVMFITSSNFSATHSASEIGHSTTIES